MKTLVQIILVLPGAQAARVHENVADVNAAVKGCNVNTARMEFSRLVERHPDVATTCCDVEFIDSRGRRNKKTPVAGAKTLDSWTGPTEFSKRPTKL